jgi:hypothetical protein
MNYRVVHTLVGAWSQGQVVSDEQLDAVQYEKPRLLELGAIVPLGEKSDTTHEHPAQLNPVVQDQLKDTTGAVAPHANAGKLSEQPQKIGDMARGTNPSADQTAPQIRAQQAAMQRPPASGPTAGKEGGDEEIEEDELGDMTVPQLKEIADDEGVEYPKNIKQDDLRNLIREKRMGRTDANDADKEE